jgi:hypothetical protein
MYRMPGVPHFAGSGHEAWGAIAGGMVGSGLNVTGQILIELKQAISYHIK